MFKNVSHHAGCLVQLSKLWSDEWAGNGNRIQFLAFLVETFLVATFLVETFLFETFLFETFLFETFLCSWDFSSWDFFIETFLFQIFLYQTCLIKELNWEFFWCVQPCLSPEKDLNGKWHLECFPLFIFLYFFLPKLDLFAHLFDIFQLRQELP